MTAFFFGMGFSAQAAALSLRETFGTGLPIAGTSRSLEGARRLEALGCRGHVFDGSGPAEGLKSDLLAASHVIFSIAPDESGDPALVHHRAELDAAPRLSWLCYYSTVGVYGNHDGGWIDETAPTDAVNERSQRRVMAEAAWRDYAAARGVPLCILRLAGIYGPGRSTFDKLADGTARRVIKPGQVFNRIHVADIARVTAPAADRKLAGTFNLADDEPAPPQDLVSFAAGLAGLAPPPEVAFDVAAFSPMQRSFYADNKRVSNGAIKRALGIDLLFPTYRDGLRAIFEGKHR